MLDVEREARSRLRPLKRQAEAAELHERLERQSLEARLELARDAAGGAGRELAVAESDATVARDRLTGAERLLAAVAERREHAEEEFAAHSRRRETLSGRLFAARSAQDRIAMRLERAGEVARRSAAAAGRLTRERDALEAEERAAPEDRSLSDDRGRREVDLAHDVGDLRHVPPPAGAVDRRLRDQRGCGGAEQVLVVIDEWGRENWVGGTGGLALGGAHQTSVYAAPQRLAGRPL